MRVLFFFIVMLLIYSCSTTEVVDLIVRNANIYTMDDENPNATYLVVNNEKIVAVGSDENDLDGYQAKEIIDAWEKGTKIFEDATDLFTKGITSITGLMAFHLLTKRFRCISLS